MELSIYNQEDRLAVAQILIKKLTETGKKVGYFLKVSEDEDNADTSK